MNVRRIWMQRLTDNSVGNSLECTLQNVLGHSRLYSFCE